ncbi:hypothetical protein AB833_25525 [Chromatiales bacterium (ex Bugula neritina AB1)]|nr:hypothetical protein AB833_25525 [Chromatiales bacterium (ex Bugula neritina AB1)]
MTKSSFGEARSTCDGLQRLIRQLNGAAADVDQGGASAYELLALLATTNECVNSLSLQLAALENGFSHTTVVSTNSIHPTGFVDDMMVTPIKAASNG